MTVKFEGNIPESEFRPSGLPKLDQALGGGIPLRVGMELFGRPETGKSTLALYLAARLRPDGTIVLADLEGAARKEYVTSVVERAGFEGTVQYIEHKDGKDSQRTHEAMMKEAADRLLDDDVQAIVLDSVGSVQPVMERSGDISEAFMGRRAQTVAKFNRRWMAWLNMTDEPKLVVLINHEMYSMGAFSGVITPGGMSTKYDTRARLRTRRVETFDNGTFEAQIEIDKLTFGGRRKGREGRAMIVPGLGVHPELTAAFDCMDFGWAQRTRGSGWVKVLSAPDADPSDSDSWETVCRSVNDLLKWAEEGKTEEFAPFMERLEWDEEDGTDQAEG